MTHQQLVYAVRVLLTIAMTLLVIVAAVTAN
jgi:hypothetical protein